MNNPCKECIVKVMCQEPCDLFARQIRDHFRIYRVQPWSVSFIYEVAVQIKLGSIKLSTAPRGFDWSQHDKKSM